MRFIDLDIVASDPAVAPLIDRAEAARESILQVPESGRAALIGANRKVWVGFRPHFERIYGRKCWYTESQNPGTDDDIDHYRPKGAVAGDRHHPGYWWEALNWRNFRLSCHHSNRRRTNSDTGEVSGKGSWFPLLNEADRCALPSDHIARERPTLLDPTNPDDTALLTFDQDGRVALVPRFVGDGDAERRFEDSRKYLNLDWPAISEARQDLFTQIYRRVQQGDLASKQLSRADSHARGLLRAIASGLIELAGHLKPYSRAAQAYIMRFRDRLWIKEMVLPHIPNPLT